MSRRRRARRLGLARGRGRLGGAAGGSGGRTLERLLGTCRHAGPEGRLGQIAAASLGSGAFPVRALLFDKTAGKNWSLGWHQDRTIVVRERRDVAGFGAWTQKQGLLHVAPPPEILADMVTLRLHLDPVPVGNALLLIARGSHRLGRISEPAIDEIVKGSSVFACLADAGDVWVYATLILHASAASTLPTRRRVLQVDYTVAPLPGGLEYGGI